MTPTNKEWEKSLQAFRKVAKNIVEEQERRESGVCYHEEDGEDSCFPGTIEDDIVEALSSQAQELKEKHEADIRVLREAMKSALTRVRVNHPANCACSSCDFNHIQASANQQMLKAFDHTLSQLRSNDKE